MDALSAGGGGGECRLSEPSSALDGAETSPPPGVVLRKVTYHCSTPRRRGSWPRALQTTWFHWGVSAVAPSTKRNCNQPVGARTFARTNRQLSVEFAGFVCAGCPFMALTAHGGRRVTGGNIATQLRVSIRRRVFQASSFNRLRI